MWNLYSVADNFFLHEHPKGSRTFLFIYTVPLYLSYTHIRMLRSSFTKVSSPVFPRLHRCLATVQTSKPATKRSGDISDSFVSLSGVEQAPLPDRFRQLKLDLVRNREKDIIAGWKRLLRTLREENEIIAKKGTGVIPQVEFADLENGLDSKAREEIKKRGVVVVHGVIPEKEARGYKERVEDYVHKNPHTRGKSLFKNRSWESVSC